MNIRQLLVEAREQLAGLDSARLESEILLAEALNTSRSYLYANPEMEPPQQRLTAFRSLLKRRTKGEPIAYILGRREFWSLQLEINPDVLIPRPETELLVEQALAVIPATADWRIGDLGTGSGAIALAIAHERPVCKIHATDISQPALLLARRNQQRLGITNVQFHPGSWCEPLTGQFMLLASNPPYIATDDDHLTRGDCRFEPQTALTPGSDPLGAIREITAQTMNYLLPGGHLLLEHGYDQATRVRELLLTTGLYDVRSIADLAGHERITMGSVPG